MTHLRLKYRWADGDDLTDEDLRDLFQSVSLEFAHETELLLRRHDDGRLIIVTGAPGDLGELRLMLGDVEHV